MKIKTELLKDMLNKVIQGAGFNKFIPNSNLIELDFSGNLFKMSCTNGTETIQVSSEVSSKGEFFGAISADIFSKLISRQTCEYIDITVSDTAVKIKGNGVYLVEIVFDEENKAVVFPDVFGDYQDKESCQIDAQTIRSVLKYGKAAIATTDEIPCYTGFYCADKVVATDSFKLVINNVSMFDSPKLISGQAMELLKVFGEGGKITVYQREDELIFAADGIRLRTVLLDGIEDYAIDAIQQLADVEFMNTVRINRQALLDALNRVALFVTDYDEQCVSLQFDTESVILQSKSANGVEAVSYEDAIKLDACNYMIRIDLMMDMLKSLDANIIELSFGNDKAIKMCVPDVTQIIALYR